MKNFLALLIFALPMFGYGIENETTSGISKIILDEEDPIMTGYTDANGRQGYWIIYGKDAPEKPEYPAMGKVEQGAYKDNKKTGEWIFYHTDGATPRTKGNFIDGRPNGSYVKINTGGVIIEKSTYNNGKQNGDFTTYDNDGNLAIQKTFNVDGKEDGAITHYFPNGQVEYILTKINGTPTGEATRYWPDGSVKEITVYGADGKIISTTVVNAEATVATKVENGTGGPNGSNGIRKDGKDFACSGYNKLYNQSEEIWMDGTFKNCKLWDGELYKYDKDGILLKFEVWKNGAYHSDGQLSK